MTFNKISLYLKNIIYKDYLNMQKFLWSFDEMLCTFNVTIEWINNDCFLEKDRLIKEWIIEQVYSEEFILEEINNYIKENRDSIIDFLWEDWKILVVMNSAEKFSDIMIKALEISESRVERVKIQTYKNWKSLSKEIDSETKKELIEKLWLANPDQKVFVLEDLIDTWNLITILTNFLEEKRVKSKTLCLFDKQVEESDIVKAKLWEDLKTIIPIENDFVIWFWVDYDKRLLSWLEWLLKVIKIDAFKKIVNPYKEKIIECESEKKARLDLMTITDFIKKSNSKLF